MIRPIVVLAVVWLALAGATPLPLTAPPPDLGRLVPFVAAPLEKPAVPIPGVALPAPPVSHGVMPPAVVVVPTAERPIAELPPARALPCVGTFLRIASESLECGRARFAKGEYEDAVKALESAVRTSSERELTIEARYWLGEALAKLGQFQQADFTFRQVVSDRVALEYEVWAAHAGGWMALRAGDHARARDAFTKVLAGALPVTIVGWVRHGLALSQYGLGQYAEADRTWTELERRGVPTVLARDVQYWHAETFGRLGDPARAEAALRAFVAGGPHALLDSGFARLGWWALAAGHHAEAAKALRSYLTTARRVPGTEVEAEWAEAGFALALAASNDWAGARDAARRVSARRSALAVPVHLELVHRAMQAGRAADAQSVIQEVLPVNVPNQVRAWLLLMNGEAHRLAGNRDEARTQYDLAQQADPGSVLGQHAALRVAQTNFELREFGQAATDAAMLLRAALPAEIRAAATLLQGEAAYHANDHATADAAYRRAIVELGQRPEVPLVRLSLGWVALRQGRRAEARKAFQEFAAAMPEHPNAPDAALLATEMALATDVDAARRELDALIGRYPTHPRTDFARLNRAILWLRSGQHAEAVPVLRDWVTRAPFRPLLGRAQAALGAALLATGRAAEAAKYFSAAAREGVGALASLGSGGVALAEGRADDAARQFTEARDSGTAAEVAAAEYGLAAVRVQRGAVREFKQPARAALQAQPNGPMAPRLLYVLAGIGAEEKDWPAALDAAKRLVTTFPSDEAGDDALERVASAATPERAWPVVYEAYTLMRQRYPSSPFLESGRMRRAQAALETGRIDEARRDLEGLVQARPTDAPAWVLLARAREGTGDRRGAIDAFSRASQDAGADITRDALLGHARLLAAERRWDQARAVYERLLTSQERDIAVDAAYSIGETYRGEGDQVAAAEYYMTAAYLAPESPTGRRAMLAAAQSFATAKHPDAAAAVYRKLLAQANVPPEVANAARQGLTALGR